MNLKYQDPYRNFLKLNKGKKCLKTGKTWTKLAFVEQFVYYRMTVTEIK